MEAGRKQVVRNWSFCSIRSPQRCIFSVKGVGMNPCFCQIFLVVFYLFTHFFRLRSKYGKKSLEEGLNSKFSTFHFDFAHLRPQIIPGRIDWKAMLPTPNGKSNKRNFDHPENCREASCQWTGTSEAN